ncbi:MAG: hypothetical protein IPG45_03320 [Deltaproteobacteria bacterium]|jgi:hypothetical protein|nr:hypothetical protein [Deltaproteobacteria bacterium]
MILGALAILAVQATIGLPPPLCRGRVVSAYDPRLDQHPRPRAIEEIRAAYMALCPTDDCGAGEIFENETIGNNAATWVSGLNQGNGTRVKIVYSARFLNGVSESFGPGASFGILAHEVGHHLTAAKSMRGGPNEPSWNEELRADYLAGCALGRSGRSSAELENALRALAAAATSSHPSFAQRNPIVRRGYQDCQGQAGIIAKDPRTFGLGNLVEDEPGKGCWAYFYRLKEQVDRVGPVAAKRRHAGPFGSQKSCQQHQKEMAEIRVTEECRCE